MIPILIGHKLHKPIFYNIQPSATTLRPSDGLIVLWWTGVSVGKM